MKKSILFGLVLFLFSVPSLVMAESDAGPEAQKPKLKEEAPPQKTESQPSDETKKEELKTEETAQPEKVVEEKTEQKEKVAQPQEKNRYTHPKLGVSFAVPQGFKKSTEDDVSVLFVGPFVNGYAMGISLNTMELPGVKKEIMYQSNAAQYQNPNQYQNFQEVGRFENAVGFQAEEKAKSDETELHRRYMMLFTDSGKTYSFVVSGTAGGMKKHKEAVDQFFSGIKI